MKKLSKLLALVLVICLALTVSVFASGEPASGEASSAEPAAAGKTAVHRVHPQLAAG